MIFTVPDEELKALGEAILADSAGTATGFKIEYGELSIHAQPNRIVPLLEMLRDNANYAFVQLTMISGVDYPDRARRFDVVYQLLSFVKNRRVRVTRSRPTRTPPCRRSFRCIRRRTGTSARRSTCTASSSRATRTCAASSPTTASTAIRCARTSR